jgi:oligopeptidase B
MRNRKILLRGAILAIGIVFMTTTPEVLAQTAVELPQPPSAKKVHTNNQIHGYSLPDDYGWLRDKANPEVAQYLEAENAYTDAMMRPTKALQKSLYDEMVAHIKETDDSVPYREGEYFYYSRTEKGKQYPILCRKHKALGAPEQIMLDINKLAEGEKFMAIGAVEVSDDGNLLAYSTDNTGFRQYRLHVRDLRTGQDFSDTAEKTGSIAWSADNKTLFYTIEDHAKRQYRLYRHVLGTSSDKDVLVYEESDERFNIDVSRTRSKKYIVLGIGSHITSEMRLLDAANATGEFKIVEPRHDGVEYYVADHDNELFIRTNDTGTNFRLVTAPIAAPGKANWKELIPPRTSVMLEDVETFKDFYVLFERDNGLPVFRVGRYGSTHYDSINFPEPTYTALPRNNAEWETTTFRYAYQSLITPASVFDYDVNKKTSELKKQTEVPGYDKAKYASERIWVTARDGVKVPVSIAYRKDLKTDENPLYVYGYGSYGYATPVGFNSNRLSMLDRGVVFGILHIRGGGDLGKAWHDEGKMMKKKNTFNDFVDATEYLVTHGYGDRNRVAAEGGSAGGLLMGAITNMRPDLYRAVVSHVPFVDVMNTMLDASLPLTVPEYEEWGNPNEKAAYDYMRSYSPYDNLKSGKYPAILVKTSFNDSQVMYWEPAKYTAKLRTLKQDGYPLLLKTNMAAGHGGASGRYDYLHEIALDYGFMLWQLGVVKP